MAEKKQHAFASPELHWFDSYLGWSHVLKRNALTQNLINKENRNANLVAPGSSYEASLHLSLGRSPNGKPTNKETELREIITSATIDIAARTATAPIERVYLSMQCQNEMIKAGRLSTPYKGMKDCLIRTIKHEGVMSLWRGNAVTAITTCAVKAFPVVVFRNLPYRDDMVTKFKESPLLMLPFFFTPIMLWMYPLDYARVRLATNVKADGKRQFNGIIDVYKKTLQLDGVHGLYRGLSLSCILAFVPYMIIEKEKNMRKQNPTILASFLLLGSLPIVLHPLETVSKRMMMTSGEASKYRGVMDAFYQIVKTEGVSSLFRGLTPLMIHTITMGLVFSILEDLNNP